MIILVHQLYLLAKSAFGWFQWKPVNGVPVVVIVNTNFKRWEMGNYLNLAATNNYAVIIVKHWSRDADKLAEFNKLGVTADIIGGKLRAFKDVIPLYYGWFLNEQDSKLMYELGTQFPQLKDKINIDSPAQMSVKQEEVEAINRDTDTAKMNHNDIGNCIRSSQDQLAQLNGEISKKEEALKFINGDIDAAKIDDNNIKLQIGTTEDQLAQVNEKVNNLESTRNTLREEIADFERLKSEYEDRLKEQDAELKHKNGDLITKQQAIDDLDEKYCNLSSQLEQKDNLEREIQELQEKKENLGGELTEVQGESQVWTTETTETTIYRIVWHRNAITQTRHSGTRKTNLKLESRDNKNKRCTEYWYFSCVSIFMILCAIYNYYIFIFVHSVNER